MTKKLLLLVVLAAACGGKNKNDAEEGGTIDPNASTGDPTDRSGSMVAPEKMDEISQLLQRKQMIVSRCLATAVESGEAPKGTHGKITYEISISPSGKTTKVEVIKTSIEVKTVQGCVKRHIEDIQFPTLPKQYDTSWTYSMEAN